MNSIATTVFEQQQRQFLTDKSLCSWQKYDLLCKVVLYLVPKLISGSACLQLFTPKKYTQLITNLNKLTTAHLEANLPGYILIKTVLCVVLITQQFMPKFVLQKTANLLHSTLFIKQYIYMWLRTCRTINPRQIFSGTCVVVASCGELNL